MERIKTGSRKQKAFAEQIREKAIADVKEICEKNPGADKKTAERWIQTLSEITDSKVLIDRRFSYRYAELYQGLVEKQETIDEYA